MVYKIHLDRVAIDNKIKLIIFVDCEFTTVCFNKDSKGCVTAQVETDPWTSLTSQSS